MPQTIYFMAFRKIPKKLHETLPGERELRRAAKPPKQKKTFSKGIGKALGALGKIFGSVRPRLTSPQKPLSPAIKEAVERVALARVEEGPMQLNWDEVMLSGQWAYVDSSNVKAFRYFINDFVLEVEYWWNAIYQYEGVPVDVYRDMSQAESVGSFIWDTFRRSSRYAATKIRDGDWINTPRQKRLNG